MTRDAVYIELRELAEQMKGISPKTELYQKLQAKVTELKKRTGGMMAHQHKKSRDPLPKIGDTKK